MAERVRPHSLLSFACALLMMRALGCVGDDPEVDGGGAPADAAATDAPGDAAGDALAAIDAGPACDPTAPFGVPALVPGLNSDVDESAATFSANELTAYIARATGDGGSGQTDLFVASRGSTSDPFADVTRLDVVNTAFPEDNISTTADGLTIYFHSTRANEGGIDRFDIYRATRPSLSTGLTPPQVLASASSSSSDREPFVTLDGNTLYFVSNRDGAERIYRAEKSGADFGAPVAVSVPAVPSTTYLVQPVVSEDGKSLFFATAPGTGPWDIYVATRSTTLAAFGAPVAVAELNTANDEAPTWISPDGCRLYFRSDRPGGVGKSDIWVAARGK